MADIATNNIADYIKGLNINIAALSRDTGVSDDILRRSIVRRERNLRADEMISICLFLRKNPFDFYQDEGRAGSTRISDRFEELEAEHMKR